MPKIAKNANKKPKSNKTLTSEATEAAEAAEAAEAIWMLFAKAAWCMALLQCEIRFELMVPGVVVWVVRADEATVDEVRAARAEGFGNKGGGGNIWGGGGPVGGLRPPLINIKARVFSAAAAAAIRLLFSASESRGERNK